MELILYTADCTSKAANCLYPHEKKITNRKELVKAIAQDQVFAKYKDSYRSIENFISSSVIPLDCDNDHSEKPEDWLTADKLTEIFEDMQFVLIPSRNHMKEKNGKAARPKYHVLFSVADYTDPTLYAAVKSAIQKKYPFFDDNAVDAARFFFGSKCTEEDVVWHDGFLQIDEDLDETDMMEQEEATMPIYMGGSITEGSRNNTMSHFAGRVLKKFGITDKAHQLYMERAEKCEPPLSKAELDTIWKSAVKFANKVQAQDGYIPPDKFNDEFGAGSMKPEDYSDIGEAKVLSRENMDCLRFTNATGFLTYCGDRWHEDTQKALGITENFLDIQLADADEAIKSAEDALIAAGVPEESVRAGGKTLEKAVPAAKMGLLYALIGAQTYHKFVMKYRNYKNIVNTQNAAKPMLAIDVSELDYDAELLNTPEQTYDLTKGMAGGHPHDPDDLITKVTNCSPGDEGMQLWLDTLDTFFCKDKALISYVQEIVGMAAVGKVYAEHMIIAYGGGANGKSTFWNTIARVLGNYSGKISAEALTMNCKRNVKPEMAELKGKRLIIASELEEGTRLNTGMVKQLCSVDPIEAEKKYRDPFHFDPSHTLVLYTNHLPKVSANDDGTWRRLIVIPFNAKITGKSDIKNFSDYLFEHAGSAIMKWIIEGAEIAINKGFKFTEPQVVVDAINEYRENNDWLGQFIEEHCDVDPSYSEKSGELYQQYRVSCIQCGEFVRSTSDFYGSLEKAGFFRYRKKSGRVIVGLKLKDGQDFLE
jgi:putative DNA primase/helicase|nr:MAG TPA: dsDNA helicase [Caudoviricetes sp.]